MRKHIQLVALLAAFMLGNAHGEPTRIIYDTDMGNDVDDALALAVIHALESRGECDLLAVTITKDHDECAPYIDAVNTFYGRGDIPIGRVRDGKTPKESKFTKVAAGHPHDLKPGTAPDAVAVLRETLAGQPDESVVIAQVGFSTNLARLLDSKADAHSDLDGMALVKKKVKLISIMAGAFEPIDGKTHREYNVVIDVPSAQALASRWPTPIIWSGYEIGLAIRYPAASIEQDYGYVESHPIQESYQLYSPTPHERPTWDLTSVLWAVRPDRGYFDLSEPGIVTVDDEGVTTFEKNEAGKHRFLIADDIQKARVREMLVALSSEPPH